MSIKNQPLHGTNLRRHVSIERGQESEARKDEQGRESGLPHVLQEILLLLLLLLLLMQLQKCREV
jgi:hypothetical protein